MHILFPHYDFLVKYDPVMFWSGFRIHPTWLSAADRCALDLSWCSWKLLCSLFVMRTASLRAALVCNIVSWCNKACSHFYYQQQICLSVAFLAKTKSLHVLGSTWEQKEDGCWDFPLFLCPLAALCWGVLVVEYSVSVVSTALVSVSAGVCRAVSSSCHPHSGRGPSGGHRRLCFGLKEQVLEMGWCGNSPSRCGGPACVKASFPRRITITVWIFTNSLLTVKWLRVGKMMKVFLVTFLCKAL